MEKTTPELIPSQRIYLDYLAVKIKDAMEHKLSVRVIIDFKQGIVNSIQEQLIWAGVSSMTHAIERTELVNSAQDV